MKRIFLALVLVFSLVLSGCGSFSADPGIPHFAEMEYSRPDMTALQASLDAACAASEGDDFDTLVAAIDEFYVSYDWFCTAYSLADIHYCTDLTDIYWEKEYNYCADNAATADAALEALYYCLAGSPLRSQLEAPEYYGPGFFDGYEGENPWDETFTGMLEEEAELISRYYTLSTQGLDQVPGTAEYYDLVADDMASLLAELIGLRQEIAAYWGYEDYAAFAGDFYYSRDYTPEQMEDYLEAIRRQLVPLYQNISDEDWEAAYVYSSEEDTLAFLERAAKKMGGTMEEAFEAMTASGLYDIAYGENKFDSSFETYLVSYGAPFLFLNPDMTKYDCLALAHEFGHFCNDYACYGSYSGLEVTEVFSQGMEYLALCCSEDAEDLLRMKLADSLCVYVEQSAFAAFEQRMYRLTGEDLTAEGLYALYDQVAREFGLTYPGFDPREFVSINHYYTNPLYVISYVVSNDAAMQIYQLEQQEEGAGLALMEESLYTQQYYFQDFLRETGLESPFTETRIQAVTETFAALFG